MNWQSASAVFVLVSWILLAGSIVAMPVNFGLWISGHISDRAMIGQTLLLSWLAITVTAFDCLTTAYVKKDVEP